MRPLLHAVPTLGEIIRQYREARGMSQAVLARGAKVEGQTISNIETGATKTMRYEKLERVAKMMGTTPEELLRQANTTGGPLELPPSLADRVRADAAEQGKEPVEYVSFLVDYFTDPPAVHRKGGGRGRRRKAGGTPA